MCRRWTQSWPTGASTAKFDKQRATGQVRHNKYLYRPGCLNLFPLSSVVLPGSVPSSISTQRTTALTGEKCKLAVCSLARWQGSGHAFHISGSRHPCRGQEADIQAQSQIQSQSKTQKGRKEPEKQNTGTENADMRQTGSANGEQHVHRQLSSLALYPEASESPPVSVAACSDTLKVGPASCSHEWP